ncbi:hypothetical protein [Paenarthrobacter sp. 4246]|uniref:hypothetical protein n=1 Tax=Paenarthrobacter sp. 4246 TaxID=3156456 RepID=UPI00339778FE
MRHGRASCPAVSPFPGVLFGGQDGGKITVGELEAANAAILADLYTVWANRARVLAADATV